MRAKTATYCREEAKQCRELAERTRDADRKAHLLDVARQYDALADKAKTPD